MSQNSTNLYPVAVIIPAKDESERISSTIRAAQGLPGVDLIVVVDDGSTDDTQEKARAAGAETIRHSVNRGKAAAMESGAKVVACHDDPAKLPHLLLFLDADLGATAAAASPLIEPVRSGNVDCSIAVFPKLQGAGGRGFVKNLSRKTIAKATGWQPQAPLSGQRCLTREAFMVALPLGSGWGVETEMTVSLLVAGFSVQEILCQMNHRVSRKDFRSQLHRLDQYIDVWKSVFRLKKSRKMLPVKLFKQVSAEQKPGEKYQIPGIRQ